VTVVRSNVRNWVGIEWDPTFSEDERVNLKAVNPNGGDVSTKENMKNDGQNVINFPDDYAGTAQVIISDSAGNTEEGDITV
jgi:hypothetical protein